MQDFHFVDAAISLLVIAGQWCIARHQRAGWLIWMAANALLITVAWNLARYGQVPGYLVMTFFNFLGYRMWSRHRQIGGDM